MCVLSIDLDDLKKTNDARGHGAGDELLKRASRALREGIRDQDTLARLGGDEFAVLLVDCTEADAKLVLARLEGALARAAP